MIPRVCGGCGDQSGHELLGRPVGYRYDNLMGVLNAIRQTSGPRLSTLSIFFIAAREYPPTLSAEQRQWFDGWAAKVRQSIKAGESTYLRDPAFDQLLSLLFPEMAAGLAKPFGKLAPGTGVRWDPERGVFVRPETPRTQEGGPCRGAATDGQRWAAIAGHQAWRLVAERARS